MVSARRGIVAVAALISGRKIGEVAKRIDLGGTDEIIFGQTAHRMGGETDGAAVV